MHVIYAHQPFSTGTSIFLAGPTPRSIWVESWRPDAIALLEARGFDGAILSPEPADGVWAGDYDGQIDWETEGLNRATCILFWIPRNLATMPAFTTNDEWGYWKASGKVVLGTPPEAEKVRYQRRYAEKNGIPCLSTLVDTVDAALGMIAHFDKMR